MTADWTCKSLPDPMPLNETRFDYGGQEYELQTRLQSFEGDIMVIGNTHEKENINEDNYLERSKKDTQEPHQKESSKNQDKLCLKYCIPIQYEEICEDEKKENHEREGVHDDNLLKERCKKDTKETHERECVNDDNLLKERCKNDTKETHEREGVNDDTLLKERCKKDSKVIQANATTKRKIYTKKAQKNAIVKDDYQQDAVEEQINRNQSCYKSCGKLTQILRLAIIVLALLCTVHNSEELSVNWQLQSRVHFRKTAILCCSINAKSNICKNDSLIRRWTKFRNQNTSIITFNGNPSDTIKYKEEVNKNCTVSTLYIMNFDERDITVYTCSFGLYEDRKELKIEEGNFRSFPSIENINSSLSCQHSHLGLKMEIRNIYPVPMCYSYLENDEVKHIRMSTYLSGVLYTIEDTMKFVLKDHKCSGAIHSFCLFEKTKKEVINKTYNCCTDRHATLVVGVTIGSLIVITFAVIMLLVFLYKRKKMGGENDLFLQSAESAGNGTSPETSLKSFESEGGKKRYELLH